MKQNSIPGREVTPLTANRTPVRCVVPLVAVVGSSGSGKTTLIEALLPRLAAMGLRVAVVKHAHRGVELDRPGKDTYRAAAAGAVQVAVGSGSDWAVMGRVVPSRAEPSLEWLASRLDLSQVDLVLAEGFHFERCAKLEVHRPEHGRALLCSGDPDLLAIATDAPLAGSTVRLFDLNDPAAIADFIAGYLTTHRRAQAV